MFIDNIPSHIQEYQYQHCSILSVAEILKSFRLVLLLILADTFQNKIKIKQTKQNKNKNKNK